MTRTWVILELISDRHNRCGHNADVAYLGCAAEERSAGRMARVFVLGAAHPNGGTFMAYQLGRILESGFGYQPVAVRVGAEVWDKTKHRYEQEFPIVSVQDMEAIIRKDDLLVANPSFSRHMFGIRIPGKKISYVQHFNSFSLLDGRFDHYVACSKFVQNFLLSTYGISAPAIPPYVEADTAVRSPWTDRAANSVFTYLKGPHNIATLFFDRLKEIVGARAQFVHTVNAMTLSRHDLLEKIAECRFFLSLSPAEGFGLVPLEAMSVGTAVVGLDSFGGRQYFRHMENCAVASYPNIEEVAAHL